MIQLNPDTSHGLFCGAIICTKARVVNRARFGKKTTDELKKVVSQLKNTNNKRRKKKHTIVSFRQSKQQSTSVITRLRPSWLNISQRLTYQHLGGILSNLPNKRIKNFSMLLANHSILLEKQAFLLNNDPESFANALTANATAEQIKVI